MQQTLLRIFSLLNFSEQASQTLATTHTQSTMCGVNSHGINRVPLFAKYVKDGIVNPSTQAQKTEAFGNIERWDGQFGSGVLNAQICTQRAIELAKENGLGLVALKNTNHWMRGGSYGWQAASKGCIGIMFTNTQANMPPWGGTECRIGNNPLVISLPNKSLSNKDQHVVLDMAMSQFSFGKIHEYELKNETLPFVGGWDEQHQASTDPSAILACEKAMPTGYWKGSALSMVLDMLATLLAAGNSTKKISESPIETGISQVFLCINAKELNNAELHSRLLNEIVEYTKNVETQTKASQIRYPGQRANETFAISKKHCMQIDSDIWAEVIALSKWEQC